MEKHANMLENIVKIFDRKLNRFPKIYEKLVEKFVNIDGNKRLGKIFGKFVPQIS